MNNCKYLSKKINGTLKCKLYKKDIIHVSVCKNCSETIFKRNKPIKKVSKKRIFVKKEVYEKVFERDKGRCRLCGTTLNLHLHHIMRERERFNKQCW